jgi:hypothetical protein
MASKNRPPLEMDEITNNLKQSSGKGVDAFFSSPSTVETKPQEEQNTDSPSQLTELIKEKKDNSTLERRRDVMTSSRQEISLKKWREIIETTETHNSSLRMTNDEKFAIEDLLSELQRKYKIKTSLNELARLGMLYLIDNFKKDKPNALIIKVKKA